MTDTLSTIKARTSANNFDTTHVLTPAEIEELVSYAPVHGVRFPERLHDLSFEMEW